MMMATRLAREEPTFNLARRRAHSQRNPSQTFAPHAFSACEPRRPRVPPWHAPSVAASTHPSPRSLPARTPWLRAPGFLVRSALQLESSGLDCRRFRGRVLAGSLCREGAGHDRAGFMRHRRSVFQLVFKRLMRGRHQQRVFQRSSRSQRPRCSGPGAATVDQVPRRRRR
jgi:hypothetical protein